MMKFFRVSAVALAATLGGCASTNTAWQTLTGARVSPQAVYVEVNVFDGLKRTATNYLRLCHQNPTNITCSKTAEVQVYQAVTAGTQARKDLRAFLRLHPDALGAQGLVDAFRAATATLDSTLKTYGVKS